MTEENKTEKNEKEEPKEIARGERGFVGEATPAGTLKRLWHERHFKLVDANDRYNPRKKEWVPQRDAPSLKQFIRSLLKDETHGATAKRWLDSKLGLFNQGRSEKNVARISLEKQATKAAKRKRSQGKQGKDKAAPAAK